MNVILYPMTQPFKVMVRHSLISPNLDGSRRYIKEGKISPKCQGAHGPWTITLTTA